MGCNNRRLALYYFHRNACKRGYSNIRSYYQIMRDSKHPRKTALYGQYYGMLQRCYNPKASGYDNYGKRGVRVCARWFYSFDNFVDDMGQCPKGHTLDRIDNNKAYSPDNCKWSTRTEQNLNQRRTATAGVYQTAAGTWMARVHKNNTRIAQKTFKTKNEAVEFRKTVLNTTT